MSRETLVISTPFLLGSSQYGWDRVLSKRTAEDASPYEFDEILNLGDTPHDAIGNLILKFHPHL